MKVLIVEPNEALAAQLASVVQAAGIAEVLTATNSDSAVDAINHSGGVDILASEVFLQPADGFSLHETIRPYLPGLKVIFFSEHDLGPYADRVGDGTVLHKPFDGVQFLSVVRKLAGLAEPVTVATPAAVATPVAQAPQPAVRAAPGAAHPVAATPQVSGARVADGPLGAARPKAVAAAVQATPVARAATPVAKVAMPVAKAAVPSAVVVAEKAKSMSARLEASQHVSKAEVPKAIATARASASVAAVPQPVAPAIGTIGNYLLQKQIGEDSAGMIYKATQQSIGREVELHTLDEKYQSDAEAVQRFIANASVKANVRHPYILTVYEAGESEGKYYYAGEYIEGVSLAQMHASGTPIDDQTALRVIKIAAEVLKHLDEAKVHHEVIRPESVILGKNNHPRIRNLAANDAANHTEVGEQIRALAGVVEAVLSPQGSAGGVDVRTLLAQMQGTAEPVTTTWDEILAIVKTLEPKVVPVDAYKLNAQDRAAIKAVEEAKKRQKRSNIYFFSISLCLLALALGTVYWLIFMRSPKVVKNEMVKIPAGEFIYQDGQKEKLPEFWIDAYEVTIAQYAEFLDWIKKNPGKVQQFEHPDQPKGKSHVPTEWAKTEVDPGYYERAKRWKNFNGGDLDINSPVMNVDWFSAFAYAKWRGNNLPTEQQWEKAARGTDGRKYPWGNDADDKKADTGADTGGDPKEKGKVDGFKKWAPVNAMKGDKSPYDIYDMAGNVSEWTASTEKSEKFDAQIPVIRGGNFRRPLQPITTRQVILNQLESDQALGFRTVSETAPKAAPAN